jgi:hypothetical protein
MMEFREWLIRERACQRAIAWVGSRTLAEAWLDCTRPDWMLWLVYRAVPLPDHRYHLIAADCAERVLHLVKDDAQLACAWAIDAARRGDKEEMHAASDAAYNGAGTSNHRNGYAAAEAAAVAAEGLAAAAAYHVVDAAVAAVGRAARAGERNEQCNIIRSYVSVDEIARSIGVPK